MRYLSAALVLLGVFTCSPPAGAPLLASDLPRSLDSSPRQSPTATARATQLLAGLDRDLRVLDKAQLTKDERKQRDQARALAQRARQMLREARGTNELDALALVTRASKEAAPLVVRLLKLDDFVLSAEQYRSGKISAAIETDSTRLASDLDVPIRYIEDSRDRIGLEGTALAAMSDKTLAAVGLLQTEIAFRGWYDAPVRLSVARRLLAIADASRLAPRFFERWCIVVAGHLQGELQLAQALVNAEDMAGRFPRDADVLAVAGMFYELIASPSVELPKPDAGGRIDRGSGQTPEMRIAERSRDAVYERLVVARREGLARAEELYRKALAVQDDYAEAHLRLGRIMQLTGRPDLALHELQIASASRDARTRYVAAILQGMVHEAGEHMDAALASYQEAVRACPGCLTAGIALSHAQRRTGAVEASDETLDAATSRDAREAFFDFWWEYPLGVLWQVDDLMAQLRGSVR